MPQDLWGTVEKLTPGIIGSVGAMLWVRGSLPHRLALVMLGSAASYYGAHHVATITGMGEGLAGFLVGLFGMSIVDSIFKTWSELGLSAMLREFIRARLGLGKETKE